jgi:hypothetical protein
MTILNPNPSFSITMGLETPNRAGMLASIAQAIASVGGNISAKSKFKAFPIAPCSSIAAARSGWKARFL